MLNGYPIKTRVDGHMNSAFKNNIKCTRPGDNNCFALGRPPYVNTHDRYCDGFLWFGTWGMDSPTAVQLAGVAQYSPYTDALPPTSSVPSDGQYDALMERIVQRDTAPDKSPIRDEVLTSSSYLRDKAGIPDNKGWYTKGDPRHSTASQRSPANAPQKHPCKRTDFGGGPSGFKWPQC